MVAKRFQEFRSYLAASSSFGKLFSVIFRPA